MKKNGFTLIELLAVIVILAIIVLIATPVVVNIIEDSKMNAVKLSADNYLKALDTTLLSNYIYDEEDTKHLCDIVLTNGESYIECDHIDEPLLVDISGDKPVGGIVEVINNKVVEYEIDIGGKTLYSYEESTPSKCFETSENDNGTLTITNYLCGLYDKPKILDVVIPKRINGKRVTIIGSYAFWAKKITSVVLPEGIESTGYRGFGENNLTSIKLPSTLKEIPYQSFSSNKLTSIEIPKGVTKIGNGAFISNKLTSVTIPNTTTQIEGTAFLNNSLQGNDAFIYKRTGTDIDYSILVGYGGASGADVVIPQKQNGVQLKSIEYGAFWGAGIKSVILPQGLERIGYYVFANNQLTDIIIPHGVTQIEYAAFSNNKLATVSIPVTADRITTNAFMSNQIETDDGYIYKRTGTGVDYSSIIGYGGKNRKEIVLPKEYNGVLLTTIYSDVFNNIGLETLVIPEGVTAIGARAFANNKLTSVIIKGKSSLSEFKSYPSSGVFGWASGYSDANIVFES